MTTVFRIFYDDSFENILDDGESPFEIWFLDTQYFFRLRCVELESASGFIALFGVDNRKV